jgi:hypothetical protein
MARTDPWASMAVPEAKGELTARRADSKHPYEPWWVKDHAGHRGLQFEFPNIVAFPTVLPRLHGIALWADQSLRLFRLTLQQDQEWELFHALSEDILNASFAAGTSQGAVEAILRRLDRWQRFLAKDRRGLLTEQEIRGLFGELAFLHDELLPRFGARAIGFWNGPKGSPQDFAVGSIPIEVKTRTTSAPARITISSPDQLWPALPEMYLAVYPIAESPTPGVGRSLAGVVELLRQRLSSGAHRDTFEEKLESVGYFDLPEYEAEVFLLGTLETFRVVDGFPRILPSAVPDGVDDVRYNLHLDRCRTFAAPIPWDTLGGA